MVVVVVTTTFVTTTTEVELDQTLSMDITIPTDGAAKEAVISTLEDTIYNIVEASLEPGQALIGVTITSVGGESVRGRFLLEQMLNRHLASNDIDYSIVMVQNTTKVTRTDSSGTVLEEAVVVQDSSGNEVPFSPNGEEEANTSDIDQLKLIIANSISAKVQETILEAIAPTSEEDQTSSSIFMDMVATVIQEKAQESDTIVSSLTDIFDEVVVTGVAPPEIGQIVTEVTAAGSETEEVITPVPPTPPPTSPPTTTPPPTPPPTKATLDVYIPDMFTWFWQYSFLR